MHKEYIMTLNRVLLSLVMIVPGLLGLLLWKPSGVAGNLINLGFPAPLFLAWILILSEIVFGIAILVKWRLKYTVWPPIIILVVAGITAWWGNWPQLIMHLVVASNFWLWGLPTKGKKK